MFRNNRKLKEINCFPNRKYISISQVFLLFGHNFSFLSLIFSVELISGVFFWPTNNSNTLSIVLMPKLFEKWCLSSLSHCHQRSWNRHSYRYLYNFLYELFLTTDMVLILLFSTNVLSHQRDRRITIKMINLSPTEREWESQAEGELLCMCLSLTLILKCEK